MMNLSFLKPVFAKTKSEPNVFSSAVLIEMTKWGKVYTCSGVAIRDDIVLTSAHCMDNTASNVKIILEDEYEPSKNTFVRVSYYIKHEGYDPKKSLYENDLSILFLDKKLPTKFKPTYISDHVMQNLMTRVGYGGRAGKNKKITVPVKPQKIIKDKKYFEFLDSQSVIGDSGGPVFALDKKGHEHLVGLHSTKEGEGKTYSLNLRHFKDWIDQKIKNHKAIEQKAI